MTRSASRKPKPVTLSVSRDIAFDKLVLSQSNVRRIKAGVAIEELAEDIARRTLLQSLTVRAVTDEEGRETGLFEVPSGGRRYRALELLVQQKRLSRTAPIPCIIRDGGIAEEDSLAENVQRAPLHPLDQFRAFQTLKDKGLSEEGIAASFFISAAVVKQRLKLAAVSPKLLELYAEDSLTLDQLMAFTINGDHARQEQVYERLAQSYSKEPYVIRRMLTEGAVRAHDKRAQFIGLDAYEAAGGTVLRDLFQGDSGGWLQDVPLVDRLVMDKLRVEAERVRHEGWAWIDAAPEFPYGHTAGLRQLVGEAVDLSPEEEAAREALEAEHDRLMAEQADGEDLPQEVDQRLDEIETALAALRDRPMRFDPADMTRAGCFVSIDVSGRLRVERGFVRPEDELRTTSQSDTEVSFASATDQPVVEAVSPTAGSGSEGTHSIATNEQEDDRPLSERLLSEMASFRTLALRNALGENAELAELVLLHTLVLRLFYGTISLACLDLDARSTPLTIQPPNLAETNAAKAVDARHSAWRSQLPDRPAALWDALLAFDAATRKSLLAHCIALCVNGLLNPVARNPRAEAVLTDVVERLDLDLIGAGWITNVETYLGRVSKSQILSTVREACGAAAAERLAGMRKGEMAEEAERLLTSSTWLPQQLRRPVCSPPTGETAADHDPVAGLSEPVAA